MSTASAKRRYTVAEYIALEADSLDKHEFYRGEIFAMAGASFRHNQITGNTYHALRNKLAGKTCQPFGSDLRIRVQRRDLYTYADALVVCGKAELTNEKPESVTNPRVIVEVLSKSTENYDRGQKWEFYQQLDSLREYLLVSQEEAKVTRYYRESGGPWMYELVAGLDQNLRLSSIECELPLAEIYENVELGPEVEEIPPASAPPRD
jgi:Uma2 family endonuclease